VSSVVGPVIVYMDRFILGAVQSPEAVGYYSAPFEMVSRLLIIPAALSVAMFPAMVELNQRSKADAQTVRRLGVGLVLLVSLPFCIAGAVLARPLLQHWLGTSFAEHGTLTMQLLLPGFALNAVAQVPMTALQSLGRAKWAALMHLTQLPLYAILLLVLTRQYGAAGASVAWSIRAALDCLFLFVLLRLAEAPDRLRRTAVQQGLP